MTRSSIARLAPALLTLVLGGLVLAGCGSSGSTESKPAASTSSGPSAADKSSMNTRTRGYVRAMFNCNLAVNAWTVVIAGETDPIALSSATGQAKTMCGNAGTTMIRADTSHFSDQADDAWTVVDTCKSALGSYSDFIDSGEASKAVSAQSKMADCTAWFGQALAEINQRRAVYGLPRLRENGDAVARKMVAPKSTSSDKLMQEWVGKGFPTAGAPYFALIAAQAALAVNPTPGLKLSFPARCDPPNKAGNRIVCIVRTSAGNASVILRFNDGAATNGGVLGAVHFPNDLQQHFTVVPGRKTVWT